MQLPKPQTTGGKPVMQALAERKSSRRFASEPLSPQVLSNLLWAAFGFNRPGMRTAPSAHNAQETELFVVMAAGIYRYDAKANVLEPVLAGDRRALAGTQDFVKIAPVSLVYVADLSRLKGAPDEQRAVWAAVSVGAMVQNVYLYCASEGLGAVVRAWIDGPAFAKATNLRPDQRVIIAQTVGYPGK